jgi:hypothetical protein
MPLWGENVGRRQRFPDRLRTGHVDPRVLYTFHGKIYETINGGYQVVACDQQAEFARGETLPLAPIWNHFHEHAAGLEAKASNSLEKRATSCS